MSNFINKTKSHLKKYKFAHFIHKSAKKTYRSVQNTSEKIHRNLPRTDFLRFPNYVMNNQLDNSNFIEISKDSYSGKHEKKLIAYYLPQYYQIKQNDDWFGRGFTEWTNVTKATPQFNGHWQPHLPIDVGYYNLETTNVMYRQIELAKQYGLYGFCFYYYWFSGGDKIMEKPLQNWLADKNLDFPFMFFWANEDWTNTWGAEGDLGTKTYSAKMKPSDVKKFVDDIEPYLNDSRYITVDNRPHVIIYQAKKDPYLSEFIDKIGTELEKRGSARPYISLVFPDDFSDEFNPADYGADAAVEFGAHLKIMPPEVPNRKTTRKLLNRKAVIKEYDMEAYISSDAISENLPYTVHKGAMVHFDNTARKIYKGAELFSISPRLYKKWLKNSLDKSNNDQVFITAWNEWAEGMHLEPDHKYGYAYLQATREALEEHEAQQ